MGIDSLDFDALLSTNEPLSAHETCLIQECLREKMERRIAAKTQKLADTSKAMNCTILELGALLDRIKENPGTVHDIPPEFQDRCMRLNKDFTSPTEIDCEIFKQYCRRVEKEPSKAPFLLCSISKGWRSLALADPELWTRLDLTVTRREHVDFCRFFLLKSGDMPLELSFRFAPASSWHSTSSSSNQFGQLVINLCLPHLPRWKTFSYTGRPDLETATIDPAVQAPLLQKVSFTSESGRVQQSVGQHWASSIIRAGSGSLKSLQWSWLLPWTASMSTLGLNNLTSFTMARALHKQQPTTFTCPEIIQLLRLYPLLQTCDIILGAGTAVSTAIVHQHLRSLRLYVDSIRLPTDEAGAAVSNIFTSVTLPALGQLDIQFSEIDTILWPQETFITMLQRSHCSLRKLQIHGAKLPDDFELCFSHHGMKDLERLSFRCSHHRNNIRISNSTIVGLGCQYPASQPLPNLLQLELHLEDNQLNVFERMAMLRKEAGRSPSILLGGRNVEQVIDKLGRQGVDITRMS
ncbi:hypothetical protein C8J56DRAFT_888169 [Mycena floridula]|nr:hypothetical protein C8J56DRAFT_888169 [Mycena floridula]